jgi:hypothetical protein
MTKPTQKVASGLVAVSLATAAFIYWDFASCAISEAEATQMVMAEMSRAGLDPQFLTGPTQTPGSCSFNYDYDGDGHKISYVIADDLMHGPELNSWDYGNEPNGP